MIQGKVKWFDGKKGYGFIQSDDGKDYFVHHSDIVMEGYRTLDEGTLVQFDVEKSDKGFRAVRVALSSEG